MILWLASYPRSGNTFFRVVLHHVYNLKTFSVYDEAEAGVADVTGHEKLPAPLAELAAAPETYIIKTHNLPQDNAPAVYLIRDGRDAIVSHANYLLSFRMKGKEIPFPDDPACRFERVLEDLIADKPRFGGWSTNVRAWAGRLRAKTVVIRFEDLIASPQAEVEKGIAALGLNLGVLSGVVVPDFASLQAQSPEFFRKGKPGAGRDEMPERLHQLFLRHHRVVMEQFGYSTTSMP